MLIHDLIDYYALNTPDAPAISAGERCLSYGDIADLSNRLANGIRALGVGVGDRIAMVGENSIEHALMLIAASKSGAVAVPLNYRLSNTELAYVIADAEVQVLFALNDTEANFESLAAAIPQTTQVITQWAGRCPQIESWLQSQSATAPQRPPVPGAAFLQLYTSGTTGNPKGVVLSQSNLLSLCRSSAFYANTRPDFGTCGLIVAPLFHIGGSGPLLVGLYYGQHMLLHANFEPQKFLDDIENNAVISVFMVPAMIMFVLSQPDIEQRDFSKLKQVIYGASPISETVLRRALAVFKCDFMQVYGMTETTGTVISLSAADHRRALTHRPELLRSAGRAIPGVEIKIMDTTGSELASGEIGEVWLRSASSMTGYFKLPEATAANLTDGWVHTGDAGYLDDEGYLFLKDRIKDMVISGGENIYPVEVENVLAMHPAIADVAVIGVPDEQYGEALLAVIVSKADAKIAVDDIIGFCRDKLAGYKIPRQVKVVDELPRNPSGKILKKILREPYWKNSGRSIS